MHRSRMADLLESSDDSEEEAEDFHARRRALREGMRGVRQTGMRAVQETKDPNTALSTAVKQPHSKPSSTSAMKTADSSGARGTPHVCLMQMRQEARNMTKPAKQCSHDQQKCTSQAVGGKAELEPCVRSRKDHRTDIQSRRIVERILKAQSDGAGLRNATYSVALRQIRDDARKSSCWIWWIWPTMTALRPHTSQPQFLLPDVSVVQEYLMHPVLRTRLLKITEAACTQMESGVKSLFLLGGTVDENKFRESLTACAFVAAAALTRHSGGGPVGKSLVAEHRAIFVSVVRCCCRALAATRQRTLCERTVKVLTSTSVGLHKRFSKLVHPWELLQLSGCANTQSGQSEETARARAQTRIVKSERRQLHSSTQRGDTSTRATRRHIHTRHLARHLHTGGPSAEAGTVSLLASTPLPHGAQLCVSAGSVLDFGEKRAGHARRRWW